MLAKELSVEDCKSLKELRNFLSIFEGFMYLVFFVRWINRKTIQRNRTFGVCFELSLWLLLNIWFSVEERRGWSDGLFTYFVWLRQWRRYLCVMWCLSTPFLPFWQNMELSLFKYLFGYFAIIYGQIFKALENQKGDPWKSKNFLLRGG